VIRNAGDAPLKITRGATSCSLHRERLRGRRRGRNRRSRKCSRTGWRDEGAVEVAGQDRWGPFRQQATVFTNDPRRPEIVFVVEGFVVPVWKAEPKSIVLTSIPSQGGPHGNPRRSSRTAKQPAQVVSRQRSRLRNHPACVVHHGPAVARGDRRRNAARRGASSSRSKSSPECRSDRCRKTRSRSSFSYRRR
jgi:hypothetical protein